MVTVKDAAIIMPASDAGTGLPWQGFNFIALAAFDIPDHTPALFWAEDFTIKNRFQSAIVPFHAAVVVMSGNFEAGVTDRVQR